ncbi:MAG: M18 family aminopeptidase [Candidatus Cloacimonetes bacterium]|nr:M18 family aminopeptidase [Candidatus Cloacimonadota bacterium]
MDKHIIDLMAFLDASPSSAQACLEAQKRLDSHGFTPLSELEAWNLKPGEKHYVIRDTSVAAFIAGANPLTDIGFHIAAAHLDSPALKLKPGSLKRVSGVTRVAVEVYGGPIISSWLDRDLGIAGRVAVRDENGGFTIQAVNLDTAVGIIPNAAIHLNREVNTGFSYNKQTHLQAFLSTGEDSENPLHAAIAAKLGVPESSLGEMDLFFYDLAKAQIGGLDQSLIISGRLDNLGMSHAILSAILETEKPEKTALAVIYDHEEIGSKTMQGAQSTFLENVLERIALAQNLNREEQLIARGRSFLVSADMAHAYHPNFPEKYDALTAPKMNGGPVIKWHAAHSYASTAQSAQIFAQHCENAGVKHQSFAMRSDLLCGSTVGPILAASLGISAVDVGNPLWAMHSIRETGGVDDHSAMIRALKNYYQ